MALSRLQGVNIMAFCKEYNAATAKMAGDVIPVEITVYEVSRLAAAGSAAAGHTSCGCCQQAAWAARAMATVQLLAAARPSSGHCNQAAVACKQTTQQPLLLQELVEQCTCPACCPYVV